HPERPAEAEPEEDPEPERLGQRPHEPAPVADELDDLAGPQGGDGAEHSGQRSGGRGQKAAVSDETSGGARAWGRSSWPRGGDRSLGHPRPVPRVAPERDRNRP